MIHELKNDEFFRCKDILNDRGLLEAKAVIEGVNSGRVFVDDIVAPTSGLIWLGNNDGFIFIGNEENEEFNHELNSFIDNTIVPEAAKVGLNWFEGMGDHSKWDLTIQEVFKHRNLGSWNQRVYVLNKDEYQPHRDLSVEPGYMLMEITQDLFENNDLSLKNIEFLQSKILEFWSSSEAFFSNGIGYCMICDNQIVSVCFSGFVVGNIHAVSIETIEEYRGKKLAQTIAKSFVNECIDSTLIPYWDCMESNRPSIAVAENLGFDNVFNYKGFEFLLK